MPTGKSIDDTVRRRVVDSYCSRPMTIAECAEINGLSNPTVIKILNEMGVKRYRKSVLFSPNMDERYFQSIDSEAKAYLIGFLITDGNVFVNGGNGRQASVSITQNEADSWVLELFLKEVRSNTSVTSDGRGTCTAAIRSDIMAVDLEKYGIVPNKTLNSFLPQMNRVLMPHLIRGILDGDGNITSTYTSLGKHKHAISFCGSHRLMADLASYLANEIDISVANVYDYRDRNLSEVKWQSIHDVSILGEWLYHDATIYFERKKAAFLNFKSIYNI